MCASVHGILIGIIFMIDVGTKSEDRERINPSQNERPGNFHHPPFAIQLNHK